MHLTIGVFDGVWVHTDAGPQRPRSAKQAAVLARLLLTPGQPVTFERIADAIWPDQPFESVRQTLRVHVSNLRKWLRDSCGSDIGEALETLSNSYRLNVLPECIDWQTFGEIVTEGQLALAAGETNRSIELFRSALDLWGDPFIELGDHEAAGAQRVLLDARRELAEDELIEAQLRSQGAADVIGVLEARTLLHPYREHAHRQLMCALYATGRQADALDVYHRLYRTLRDDLGLEPGPQVKATQAAVLAQDLVVAVSEAKLPAPSPVMNGSKQPLTGRNAELATIAAAMSQPGFIVVWGEAGAGKSRLLHEARSETAQRHGERRWIECVTQRDQSTAPLWTIRNALGLGTDSSAADEFDLNDELVRDIAQTPGTVLVIDDFQWVDEATVDFIAQLARSPHHGATVIVALRTAAIDVEAKPGQLASTLSRRSDATSITLEPLGLEAVAELTRDRGSTLSAEAVLERSGGNAFYITELLRSEQLPDGPGNVPRGVSALLADRLDAIGTSAARTLSIAAVIGQAFETDLLIRIADQSVEDVIDAISAGGSLGMVTAAADSTHTFTHRLIADAFAARLSELERCRLHDKIATVLERRSHASGAGPERAVHHAIASLPLGDAYRAVRLARQSGQASTARLAYADARHRYQAARVAADLLDDDSRDALMPSLIRDLGSSAVRAGDTEAGRDQLRQAIALANERGDDELALSAAVALVEGPSALSDTDDDTIGCVTDAVNATVGDITIERSKLLSWLGAARYFTHDIGHCRGLADEAIRVADELGDPQARAFARYGKWQASLGPDHVDERLALSAEIRSLAATSGSLAFINSGYSMGTSTAFDLGDLDMARHLNAEAAARIDGLAPSRFRWSTDGNEVIFAIADGRLDDADAAAHQTFARANEPNTGVKASDALITFGAQLATIRLLQGRGQEMVAILESNVDTTTDMIVYRAGWAAGLSQTDDARSSNLVNDLIDAVVSARNDVLTTATLSLTAEAAWSMHWSASGSGAIDRDRARGLAARIAPIARLHAHLNTYGPSGCYMGSLLHSQAQAHAVAGDTALAASAFEQAVEEHRRCGAPGFEVRSAAALDRLR